MRIVRKNGSTHGLCAKVSSYIIASLIAVAASLLLNGCKTLEEAVDSAENIMDVAESGTIQTIDRIADSDDREATVEVIVKERGEHYKDNPRALLRDVKEVKRDYQKLMNLLSGEVSEKWGASEVKVPSKKQYVKYTQNYKSRAVVDFDKGQVTVETMDEASPNQSLHNAIVTTLLTPNDPRTVDLFSDKSITLSSGQEPYLKDLVLDNRGNNITTPDRAEDFADHLLNNKLTKRSLNVGGATKTAHAVTISMVSNFSHKQAEKYSGLVNAFSDRYDISPSLVYAVIRTESNFNPYAVSSAPAYGLMQLVPTSGGRDAYRKVKNRDGIPTKDYLFDPKNNIELGTAYLNLLSYSHLEMIQNKTSREYCVISAYNTGTGNVLKTFSNNRTAAINAINSLQPPGVYKKLRRDLPYAETRHYLVKVLNYRKQFVTLSR